MHLWRRRVVREILTWPNAITAIGIVAASGYIYSWTLAPVLSVSFLTVSLVIAAFSDFFDGFVARRFNQETQLGRILDPFRDKILSAGMLCNMEYVMYGTAAFGSVFFLGFVLAILEGSILLGGVTRLLFRERVEVTKLGKFRQAFHVVVAGVWVLGYYHDVEDRFVALCGGCLDIFFSTPLLALSAMTVLSGMTLAYYLGKARS